VKIVDTAMSSEDVADVTAMKTMRRVAMAPLFPRIATAA
jgi:hypothetical protein